MSTTDERIDRLVGVVESQQEQISLLVNAVAMLLGEEMGKPIDESEPDGIERDWDGNPIG